jgi:hypothetical protein
VRAVQFEEMGHMSRGGGFDRGGMEEVELWPNSPWRGGLQCSEVVNGGGEVRVSHKDVLGRTMVSH